MKKNYLLLITGLLTFNIVVFSQQGTALNFDGINDQVTCGNNPSVQITGSQITLEAKIKIESFDPRGVYANTIISKVDQTFPGGVSIVNGYELRIGGNGKADFVIGPGSQNWDVLETPNNSLTIDRWYHLAATYDGVVMKFYIDGNEVGSRTIATSVANSPFDLQLGDSSFFSGRNLDASIDEIRIWNVARSQQEIMTAMNSELTLPQTGLMAYYTFNQGIGGASNPTEITAIDELSNSNGSLLNFTLDGEESNWISEEALSVEELSINSVAIINNLDRNHIRITGLSASTEYSIYTILGEVISKGKVYENVINTDILQRGIYILKLDKLKSFKFLRN